MRRNADPFEYDIKNFSIEHEKVSLCRMPIMTTLNKLNKRYSNSLNSITTQSASNHAWLVKSDAI